MKKLFVLLFPQNEYLQLWEDVKTMYLFNQCIRKRYIEKEYDFCIVNYKNSKADFIIEKPKFEISADISFEESSSYHSKDFKYADFEELSKNSNFKNYDNIVVGGFHCFNCVEKFAESLYKNNKSVLIDSDLTENFFNVANYNKIFWDIRTFDADKKLNYILKAPMLAKDLLYKIKERYSKPVWGVSKKMLDKIDSYIKEFEK